MSFLETTFLEATIPKGERFNKESVFDMRTHFKLTDASKYTILHNVSPTRSKERFRWRRSVTTPQDYFFKRKIWIEH